MRDVLVDCWSCVFFCVVWSRVVCRVAVGVFLLWMSARAAFGSGLRRGWCEGGFLGARCLGWMGRLCRDASGLYMVGGVWRVSHGGGDLGPWSGSVVLCVRSAGVPTWAEWLVVVVGGFLHRSCFGVVLVLLLRVHGVRFPLFG